MKPDKLDWTRFHYYARHVRRLRWENRRDVSLLALEALAMHRPAGQPLLPHLRELKWYENSWAYFSFVHLFFTPTIRTLGLTPPDYAPPDIMALLEHASKMCPHLETFTFGTKALVDVELQEAADDALARFLHGMPTLRRCDCNVYVSANCVEALAALPKLSMLNLKIRDVQPQEKTKIAALATRCSRNGQWFNTIQTLSIHVDQLDESTGAFVGAIHSEDLRNLVIYTHYHPDTYMVKKQLEVAVHSRFRESLRAVELELGHPRFESAPLPFLDVGEALRPLYSLPHIERLIIRSYAMYAGADTLQDIAHAWRRLNTLSLISYTRYLLQTRVITLDALAPLARKCPNLDVLELSMSAADLPDKATLAQLPDPSPCRLRSLTVFNAPINGSVDQVAGFLGKLFPHMDEVVYCGAERASREQQGAYEGLWKKVRVLLENKLGNSGGTSIRS